MTNPVLMKCDGGRDCLVAATATATGVSYEEARHALSHKDLPGFLESPILSNPLNAYRALIRLGFWKRNITWGDIESSNYEPGKTIVLVKENFFNQHWIVLCERVGDSFLAYDGVRESKVPVPFDKFKESFFASKPYCAFSVYKAKAINILRIRLSNFFRKTLRSIKCNVQRLYI